MHCGEKLSVAISGGQPTQIWQTDLTILCPFHFVEAGPMKIRLVGDPTKKAVVEVYDGNSRWGRICPFKLRHAQIICNHFGYTTALGAILVSSNDPTYVTNGSTTQNFIHMKVGDSSCYQTNIVSLFAYCTDAMTAECECSQQNAGVICQTYDDLGKQ